VESETCEVIDDDVDVDVDVDDDDDVCVADHDEMIAIKGLTKSEQALMVRRRLEEIFEQRQLDKELSLFDYDMD